MTADPVGIDLTTTDAQERAAKLPDAETLLRWANNRAKDEDFTDEVGARALRLAALLKSRPAPAEQEDGE